MEDKFIIKVIVADREYPIMIERGDVDAEIKEARIRKAAKKLNEAIMQLKQRKYTNKDDQDYLAMSSLHFMSKLIEFEEKKEAASPIANKLIDIDKKLSEYIDFELNKTE